MIPPGFRMCVPVILARPGISRCGSMKSAEAAQPWGCADDIGVARTNGGIISAHRSSKIKRSTCASRRPDSHQFAGSIENGDWLTRRNRLVAFSRKRHESHRHDAAAVNRAVGLLLD